MAAHTHSLPSTGTRAFTIPQRPLKLAAAAVVTVLGGYGLLCERGYVASSDAVVSSYVLDVRTPIEGTVTGLPNTAGIAVHRGQVLAHLENSRTDRQQLERLGAEESSANEAAAALAVEQGVLEAQRQSLVQRAGQHSSAIALRLDAQVSEASRILRSDQVVLKQADIDLDRGRKLHDAGIIASADFDKLVSVQQIAREQASAQKDQVQRLRVQSADAARGLYSEPGAGTDVAYSRQRADEIAIRLAEGSRLLSDARARATEAHLALASQTARFNLLQKADLVAPMDGQLWALNSLNGERASTGDTVLSLVDCSHQFLLVRVPQDRLPEIALHQRASFRLSGESTERSGMVLSVSGESGQDPGRKFASVPSARGEQLATVVISLDDAAVAQASSPDACTIGRTARVLLPTVPTSTAGRLLRHYF